MFSCFGVVMLATARELVGKQALPMSRGVGGGRKMDPGAQQQQNRYRHKTTVHSYSMATAGTVRQKTLELHIAVVMVVRRDSAQRAPPAADRADNNSA